MDNPKVLFIAGNWTEEGGRPSYYMSKLVNSFETKLGYDVVSFNGGYVSELEGILEQHAYDSNIVFWSPNIPLELGVQLNPKDYNYRVVLITFKRNDNRYSFEEMMSKALTNRSDLTCEVHKNDSGKYEMRVFDILGTLWSDYTTDTSESVEALLDRAMELLDYRYYKFTKIRRFVPEPNCDKTRVFQVYNRFGHELMHLQFEGIDNRIRRHLGELSFRCQNDENTRTDIIYSNARNCAITDELNPRDFVATKMLNGKINYYGDYKPHLETGVFDKLMLKYPDINYIFHSHCYVKDAPFTSYPVTNGSVQEYEQVSEILDNLEYQSDVSLNLLGHGSFIIGNSLDYVEEQFDKLYKRELPEKLPFLDEVKIKDEIEAN